jgi:hypothetical protein
MLVGASMIGIESSNVGLHKGAWVRGCLRTGLFACQSLCVCVFVCVCVCVCACVRVRVRVVGYACINGFASARVLRVSALASE